MRWLFLLLVYLAFGFTFNVVFNGPIMQANDAWLWAWPLGWPVIMGMWIMKWMLIFCVVALVIAVVIIWWEGRRI